MDAAKNAISEFTSKRGHRTDVDEVVNPAVTRETIKPHKHEEVTQAIDREVHQHHYHTTVQPVSHQEVLPEKHSHIAHKVEHREFRHDNEGETKQRVAAELGQFTPSTHTHETHHTQAAAPTVTGEHVHHHVHETVQPIVHKETIQPEVVHTTIPVHETHHASAQHHGMSALPMKTLSEFTSGGGILHGAKGSTHEEYEGQPRPYNKELLTDMQKLGLGKHSHHNETESGVGGVGRHSGHHHETESGGGVGGVGRQAGHHHNTDSGIGGVGSGTGRDGYGTTTNTTTSTTTSGPHNSSMGNKMDPRVDSDRDGSGLGRHSGTTGYDNTSGTSGYDNTSGTTGHGHHHSGTTGTTGTTGSSGYDDTATTTKKPSLFSRLNPLKDSDGDGKKGINE